jgi:hypothetical protein
MEFIKKLNDYYLIENHIKKINNKKFPELSLFKYSKDKSNFETVDVRQARGIILNRDNNIICYSLNKFNNRENKDHKHFNSIWKECIIEEAIEGTQIRLYYYNNEWQVTTARTILAENSKWDYIKSFQQLFNDVNKHIDYNLLNKDYTYTFILKHIENRIISNIKKNELIHIHTRNNKTCDELNVDINIKKPTVYHFNNYEDLINDLESLTFESKGYVLKYKDERYMFISNEYNKIKNLKGNHLNKLYHYIDLIKKSELEEFLIYFSEYNIIFNNVKNDLNNFINKIHNLYLNVNIHKSIKLNEIQKDFRKTIYDLHGIYLKNKTIITFDVVKDYIYNLNPGLIVKLIKIN